MSRSTVATESELFLKRPDTLDSIDKIAHAENLVIYCGAGVTVDRTGVDWTQLLQDIFNLSERSAHHQSHEDKKALEVLLATSDRTEPVASALLEFFRSGEGGRGWENEFLRPKLHDILYSRHGWREGLLLRNIVRFAVSAAILGRRVEIVTTNYDVHLEEEFRDLRDEFRRKAVANSEEFLFPGLTRRVFSREPRLIEDGRPDLAQRSSVVLRPKLTSSLIEISYIHGLVRKGDHPADGTLVLSERSFALTRPRTTAYLRSLFSRPKSVLVVLGSSLTDSPLVDALATSRVEQGAQRFAALRWPSTLSGTGLTVQSRVDDQDLTIPRAAIEAALGLRSQHLQITTLFTSSHAQTAQLVQELSVCLSVDREYGRGTYKSGAAGFSYAERLWKWWELWHRDQLLQSDKFTPPNARADEWFDEVSRVLELVENRLRHVRGGSRESYRLEAWGRVKPTHDNRRLTLVATSDGPRRKSHVPRTVPIGDAGDNASVLAFRSGKPRLTTLALLGVADSATRWKTFLSVPVLTYIGEPEAANSGYGGLVPVGVVTLASTAYGDDMASAERSTLMRATNQEMTVVRDDLIGLGRSLFTVEL